MVNKIIIIISDCLVCVLCDEGIQGFAKAFAYAEIFLGELKFSYNCSPEAVFVSGFGLVE